MATKEPDYLFLGEPTWATLPGGRVRCVQTGHEMPASAQSTYSQTKKCRAALFDAALKKRAAPLNFFEQSPDDKDKIVCKLTGVVLNKKEDAVWKHMMGKKFEQKLAEKEAEKERARGDVEMTENSDKEEQSENKSSKKKGKAFDNADLMENGTKKQSSKKAWKIKESKSAKSRDREESELGTKSLHDEEGEDDEEGGSSESSDFWMPPPGDRWDFDDGSEDRWEGVGKTSQVEVDGDIEMADGPGEDGVDNSGSDVEEVKIRKKRTSSGLSKQAKRRKAKRSRKEGSK